jgi:hypothetical protein
VSERTLWVLLVFIHQYTALWLRARGRLPRWQETLRDLCGGDERQRAQSLQDGERSPGHEPER